MADCDTLDKRTAATHILQPWRAQLPIPDGVIGAGDRMELGHCYRNVGPLGDTEATGFRGLSGMSGMSGMNVP